MKRPRVRRKDPQRPEHGDSLACGVVADFFDEQVSPSQILVFPVAPLPGRGDDGGQPDRDGASGVGSG
jgi:hypothetical protein